jgi:hypothetical protein
MGTPIFGTQNIAITGNVIIELDLLLCDSCNNDSIFTVCTNVNIAEACQPLLLTNFFEICMPSAIDTAFLPRFTEFSNSACEARLATNNCGRDLTVSSDGCVSGNLIVAVCVVCEKKIVVPVQLCVLSTGYTEAPIQQNAICTTFPTLFPHSIGVCDTAENCCPRDNDCDNDVDTQSINYNDCCNDDGCNQCDCQQEEVYNRRQRPQPRR